MVHRVLQFCDVSFRAGLDPVTLFAQTLNTQV